MFVAIVVVVRVVVVGFFQFRSFNNERMNEFGHQRASKLLEALKCETNTKFFRIFFVK
jgi:hypothetical protein